jgi:hypothetical protein
MGGSITWILMTKTVWMLSSSVRTGVTVRVNFVKEVGPWADFEAWVIKPFSYGLISVHSFCP